jgi:hypothetical protein
MPNPKNNPEETAGKATCCGTCGCDTCSCGCPKNGCRCQATNCQCCRAPGNRR